MTTSGDDAANRLYGAQRDLVPIEQFPEGLGINAAYEIQHAVVARRIERGEQIVGTKLGFTSKAKMVQMGVSDIIVGQLTDAMRFADGSEVPLSRFIHPRIEPEIVFRLARDVDLEDPKADIEKCVDAVAPGLEIIDSRYRDFRFSLADVVADNTSASGFVVGPWQLPRELDNLAMRLVVDGKETEFGSTAAILGHPVRALRALVGMARRYGFPLEAGQVILGGAATVAIPFNAALVEGRVARLGSVSVRGIRD